MTSIRGGCGVSGSGMPEKPAAAPTTSLAGGILACVLLLAATWLAALYRESVSLRPWKAYQERYFEQRRARLEVEIAAARAALASSPIADRYQAAQAVMDEEAAKNPKFKKIYEPWKRFRQDQNMWASVAENTMQDFLIKAGRK